MSLARWVPTRKLHIGEIQPAPTGIFGQPSTVWSQIVTWVTQGTAQGSLGEQIFVTMEEAVIGFVIEAIRAIESGSTSPAAAISRSSPRATTTSMLPLPLWPVGNEMESPYRTCWAQLTFSCWARTMRATRSR